MSLAADNQGYLAHLQQMFHTLHHADKNMTAAKSALLHLIMDPAGYGEPPEELHARLLLLTAEILEGAACGAREAGVAPRAASDKSDVQHSSHGRETSQATQDGCRGAARKVKPYTRPESEAGCRQVRGRHTRAIQIRTKSETKQTLKQAVLCTDSACSCEAKVGCHETPPVFSAHSGARRQFPEDCCDEADAHWVCMIRNSLCIGRPGPLVFSTKVVLGVRERRAGGTAAYSP